MGHMTQAQGTGFLCSGSQQIPSHSRVDSFGQALRYVPRPLRCRLGGFQKVDCTAPLSVDANQRLTFELHVRRWLTRSATWDINLQTDAQTTSPLSLIPPTIYTHPLFVPSFLCLRASSTRLSLPFFTSPASAGLCRRPRLVEIVPYCTLLLLPRRIVPKTPASATSLPPPRPPHLPPNVVLRWSAPFSVVLARWVSAAASPGVTSRWIDADPPD
ncbi:hypothetical protein B0H15DRAFT_484613 [Mycena belliarum]|uniref:Uncharacterized protein n=1 Tax=Mycena belliarum TaxID=1033014 RepID=A0AAD6TUP0_9AGAR|nr:hypothetical protein B0H15DRAFT_484613 [Mycena belliae]